MVTDKFGEASRFQAKIYRVVGQSLCMPVFYQNNCVTACPSPPIEVVVPSPVSNPAAIVTEALESAVIKQKIADLILGGTVPVTSSTGIVIGRMFPAA